MKKVIIVGFSAALLAGGFSSCAKTSKGKMANEWTVSKMSTESTDVYSDGDKNESTETIDGSTGTMTTINTSTFGGVTTISTINKSAVVNELSYTIEKDGTWKSVSDMIWTETFEGGSEVDVDITTTSGTWSLIGSNKTGEFKKNERVIFSVLSVENSNKNTFTVGSSSSTSESSSKDTFAEGDVTMTYVVVESKGKELQLKSDVNDTFSDTSGGTTTSGTTTGMTSMTLVQK